MRTKESVFALASLILVAQLAFGPISLERVFDNDDLDLNNTGTFSISGSATSDTSANDGWITSSVRPSTQIDFFGGVVFEVSSLTNTPSLIYNGSAFTESMVGNSLISVINVGSQSDEFRI